MDVGKAIELAEVYLREFILYIVSFFHRPQQEDDQELVFANLHRSVVFAIFSAIVGSYMWERYINEQVDRTEDVVGILADNLLRWVSLGLLLYALLRLWRVRVHILSPILSVLRVFSVAHIVAIYVAYIVTNVVDAIPALERSFPPMTASPVTAAYLVELVILWVYFWRESLEIAPEPALRWRRVAATFLFLVTVTIIVLIPISEYYCTAVIRC